MRLLATLALLCVSHTALAQTALIRGEVSDATTGEPLIQAAVIYGAEGSTTGTLTDFDGLYSIEAKERITRHGELQGWAEAGGIKNEKIT